MVEAMFSLRGKPGPSERVWYVLNPEELQGRSLVKEARKTIMCDKSITGKDDENKPTTWEGKRFMAQARSGGRLAMLSKIVDICKGVWPRRAD